MKNWIIILLVFAMPLGLYAYFDANAQENSSCKIEANQPIKESKIKIIKFSSPMCSECKEMAIELEKTMKNYKDKVILEEINVSESVNKGHSYTKDLIKKHRVTLVPTTVFIDKQGKIVKRQEGLLKENEISEILNGIIENANTDK